MNNSNYIHSFGNYFPAPDGFRIKLQDKVKPPETQESEKHLFIPYGGIASLEKAIVYFEDISDKEYRELTISKVKSLIAELKKTSLENYKKT